MKRIVIAPIEAHKDLYKKYRRDNPFCDVKFFTLEAFKKEANYQSDDSALIYLITVYKYDFDLANEYLSLLKKIHIEESNNEKIKFLLSLRSELISHNLLFKNDYFNYELSKAKIDIYFASELDAELLDIIKDKNYEFIKECNPYPTYSNYPNNVDELSAVFNQISKLISEGVKPNDISIYGLSSSDELAFLRLKENYKLNFNNAFRKNYLSKSYITTFLDRCLDVGALDALKEVDDSDETYPEFKSIIERFLIPDLANKSQSHLYKNIFKHKYLPSEKYLEAVDVINKPIVKDGGYLFIVNFVQGKCPIISRDNSFLNNKEKAECCINTSEIENAVKIDEFKQYLGQNGHIFLSYSNRNYSEKFYPSPLIKLCNLKSNNNSDQHEFYSKSEAKLTFANLKDLRRNYLDKNPLLKSFEQSKIFIPYRTYNYRYKGVNHFFPEQVLTLSYSQVKTYCQCKFKYYLDRVLDLGEDETNLNMNIGLIAHAIFERINENKSFDELYDEEVAKIENFDKYDWVYLRRIKQEIKKSFDYIKLFEKQIENPTILRETNGSLKNKEIDLDNNTKLVGKIDKLIMFADNDFAIIDYKLGHEEYSENLVQYGLSLQLPIYALIAKEGDRLHDKTLAGLFIQRFVNTKAIASKVDEESEDRPLLAGVYLNDPTIISKLDSSLSESPSRYIYSCKLKNDGTISSKRAKDAQYFDSLSEEARKFVLMSSHGILNNDFEIDPKIVSGDNKSCKYCPYRDICYRDEKAYKIYSNGTGEENGEDA